LLTFLKIKRKLLKILKLKKKPLVGEKIRNFFYMERGLKMGEISRIITHW